MFLLSERNLNFETSLERRISKGKQILDDHFQKDFIVNSSAEHSAIVIVMKYNDQCEVSVGTAFIQRNELDTIKAQLSQLLTNRLLA